MNPLDDLVDNLEDLDDDEDRVCCRVCACSDLDPCVTANGHCFWIEPDLCSACVDR